LKKYEKKKCISLVSRKGFVTDHAEGSVDIVFLKLKNFQLTIKAFI